MTKTWEYCSNCGGAGGAYSRKHNGVWKHCPQCGGTGGKHIYDVDGGCFGTVVLFGISGISLGALGLIGIL